jgi:hypothetical protein
MTLSSYRNNATRPTSSGVDTTGRVEIAQKKASYGTPGATGVPGGDEFCKGTAGTGGRELKPCFR